MEKYKVTLIKHSTGNNFFKSVFIIIKYNMLKIISVHFNYSIKFRRRKLKKMSLEINVMKLNDPKICYIILILWLKLIQKYFKRACFRTL